MMLGLELMHVALVDLIIDMDNSWVLIAFKCIAIRIFRPNRVLFAPLTRCQ